VSNDLDLLRDRLRRNTCRLLKWDIDALTAAQEVRLGRAVVLRLELDDCETKSLNNQPFDMKNYIAASEALEHLLSGGASDASGGSYEFADARDELRELLETRAANIRAREESLARDAADEQPKPDDVEAAESGPAPAPSSSVVRPQDAPPPPRKTLEEINAQKPPAHYLKGPSEPWRPYVDENGIIAGPWRR
jgi:hypothetical protein